MSKRPIWFFIVDIVEENPISQIILRRVYHGTRSVIVLMIFRYVRRYASSLLYQLVPFCSI